MAYIAITDVTKPSLCSIITAHTEIFYVLQMMYSTHSVYYGGILKAAASKHFHQLSFLLLFQINQSIMHHVIASFPFNRHDLGHDRCLHDSVLQSVFGGHLPECVRHRGSAVVTNNVISTHTYTSMYIIFHFFYKISIKHPIAPFSIDPMAFTFF